MAILKDGVWVQDPKDPHRGSLLDSLPPAETYYEVARSIAPIRFAAAALPPHGDQRAQVLDLLDRAASLIRRMGMDVQARPVKPRPQAVPMPKPWAENVGGIGFGFADVPDESERGWGR